MANSKTEINPLHIKAAFEAVTERPSTSNEKALGKGKTNRFRLPNVDPATVHFDEETHTLRFMSSSVGDLRSAFKDSFHASSEHFGEDGKIVLPTLADGEVNVGKFLRSCAHALETGLDRIAADPNAGADEVKDMQKRFSALHEEFRHCKVEMLQSLKARMRQVSATQPQPPTP